MQLTVATECQADGQKLCLGPNISNVVLDVNRERTLLAQLIRLVVLCDLLSVCTLVFSFSTRPLH